MTPLAETALFDAQKVEIFRERIIKWYSLRGNQDLPWRKTSDPWAVLVAAFLLRKTTTNQVVKIYEQFIKKYPTPYALLNASIEEVRNLIRPLGIEYRRAENLLKLAERIVKKFGGVVPCSKEELKELPGVGNYIASEVLLVAYNQPEPLLDRNMIRVIERVFGIRSAKLRPHTDAKLWSFAEMLVPKDPQLARNFNYGVLDFARKICKAKSPNCNICPLIDVCNYYSNV